MKLKGKCDECLRGSFGGGGKEVYLIEMCTFHTHAWNLYTVN